MNFTPDQLAERWSCTANTIRAMCKRNELDHMRVGKLYRIPARVVEEMERCDTVSSSSEENTPLPGQKAAQRFDGHLEQIIGK